MSDIPKKNSHVFSEISHVLVCSLRYLWNKIGENVLFSPKFHSLLSFVLWCIGFKSASLCDEVGQLETLPYILRKMRPAQAYYLAISWRGSQRRMDVLGRFLLVNK